MIVNANSLMIPLADGSVNMCVTSPPYWGLRDYGVNGQLGLESTPEAYVANIVAVMREVWRVMRDDGVVFLNLGDSYYHKSKSGPQGKTGQRASRIFTAAGAGGRYVAPCDTSDTAPVDSQGRDYLCESLCGVCREVYRRTTRNDGLLVAMLTASLSAPIQGNTVSEHAHLPTLDSVPQEVHSVGAIQDQEQGAIHVDEHFRASLESMLGESSQQLLEVCHQRSMDGVCLLCGRSLTACDLASAHKAFSPSCARMPSVSRSGHLANTGGNGETVGSLVSHISGKACDLAYRDCTTESRQVNFKPKDLVGIPWRVAFALQADGWYLRSDIIWSKPNSMPESVTDRPAKSHEYVFLLAKRGRYYYDAEAIKEPANGWNNSRFEDGKNLAVHPNVGKQRKPAGWDTDPGTHGNYHRDGRAKRVEYTETTNETRNKRSVWVIPTTPYSGAHFATFPPDLVRPCVLAGSAPGGIVFDPFCGSGTVGQVCRETGRRFVGLDLSMHYLRDFAFPRAEGKQTRASIAAMPLFQEMPPDGAERA